MPKVAWHLCDCAEVCVCVCPRKCRVTKPPALRLSHAEAMRKPGRKPSTGQPQCYTLSTPCRHWPDVLSQQAHNSPVDGPDCLCPARLRLPAAQLDQQDSAGQSPFPKQKPAHTGNRTMFAFGAAHSSHSSLSWAVRNPTVQRHNCLRCLQTDTCCSTHTC